ncbi:MAG: hypothetical protein ACOYJY_04940 [Acutalibacteraceae bacterium]|jgi:hypothetical protein
MTIAYRRRTPSYTVAEAARFSDGALFPLTPPPLSLPYPTEGEIAVIADGPFSLARLLEGANGDRLLILALLWLLWKNRASTELLLALAYLAV